MANGRKGEPNRVTIKALFTYWRYMMMTRDQLQSCIEACYSCATTCDTCASACLREDDVKMMTNCIALDIDCADICRVAAGYMARGSRLASSICQTCADICDACADECAKHEAQHCKDCADMCRRCAQECRNMSGSGPQVQTSQGQQAGIH
jgi:hypothetical protein